MSIDDIVAKVLQLQLAPWVTLTGGDPCIHEDLGDIISPIEIATGAWFNVETQGEHFPEWLHYCSVITFSPKPPSSGNIVDIEDLRYWLREANLNYQKVCIKIVVGGEDDYAYARDVYAKIGTEAEQFWLSAVSPTGGLDEPAKARESSTLYSYRWLVQEYLNSGDLFKHNVRVGAQQHVLLWPDETTGR